MKIILNFFTVFGVLGFCIKYYFENKISLGVAGVIIISSVILAALDKPIWHIVKVGVTIFSFGLLLVGYIYNMNDFISLLQPIMLLLIALFAIYLMVRNFFKSSSSNDEVHFIYDKKTGNLKKKNSWW